MRRIYGKIMFFVWLCISLVAGTFGIFTVWSMWGGVAAFIGVAIVAINFLLYLIFPWLKRFELIAMPPVTMTKIGRTCSRCGAYSDNTWEIPKETDKGEEEIILLCSKCYRAYYRIHILQD